jgi:hypothetical protein
VRFTEGFSVEATAFASGGSFSGLPEKEERATKGSMSVS